MAQSSNRIIGSYDIICYSADGNIKWSETCPNAVYDEGEQLILDLALRGASLSGWFMGLLKSTLGASPPAETTTLSGLTLATNEPASGTEPGYSRQAISRDATASGWPTLVLDSGDYRATSKVCSWNASGNWAGTIRFMFLTTEGTTGSSSGKLVSIAQLSTDRVLVSGDRLDITYSIKLA